MVKSALRTLDILECVAATPRGLSHTELAGRLGIPKSSLSGLLRDLREREYLIYEEGSGTIRIGPGVMGLANQFLRRFDFMAETSRQAAALCDEVDEAVNVVMRDGTDVVTVIHHGPRHTLAAISKVGDRGLALATASGKAIAAFLPDAEADAMLAAWERAGEPGRTGRTRNHLAAELAEIRTSFIAYSRGEWVAGVIAMAAPIFTSESAAPVASISVQLPEIRYREDLDKQYRGLLVSTARRISTLAGGLFPDAAERG